MNRTAFYDISLLVVQEDIKLSTELLSYIKSLHNHLVSNDYISMDLFETCSFLFLKRFWHICQQNYRISCKVVFVQFSTILNSIALWPNEVQSTKLEKLKIIFHHEDVFLFAGKGNTVSSCFLMLDSWDLCMLLRQRLILAYMAIYYSQLYSTRSEKYLGLTKYS